MKTKIRMIHTHAIGGTRLHAGIVYEATLVKDGCEILINNPLEPYFVPASDYEIV